MSGVNLKYIKGVRTRFFNVLEKEVCDGENFLDVDISSLSLEESSCTRKQINECKGKIDVNIEKLSNQSEKLAEALGDTDEELTNQLLQEDSTLSEKALSVSYKLKCLGEDLKEGEMFQQKKEKEYKESDYLQKFCDFQMNLQHKFFAEQQERSETQLRLQQEYNEKLKEERSVRSTSVKLPKLDIASFNGNKLLWVEFWDSFQSAIHNNETLSDIDKFNYLKGKLTVEAKSSVDGLSLSNENYSVAIGILEERFGDKQDIIDLHYKRLIDLAPARNTTESLRFFMDKAEKHIRSLEVLHENINQHVFVSMLRSKIPSDILLQLELLKDAGKMWSVQMLRDVLRQYIVSREKAEKYKPNDNSNQRLGHKQQYPYSKPMGQSHRKQEHSGGALMSTERNAPPKQPSQKCRFCDKGHWSDECPTFKTAEERKKRIKGSCFRCLKDNHLANECKSSKICVYCKAKDVHHRSLCDKKFSKSVKKEKESAHISQEVEETDVTRDESGLLSCDETVFMQTATVKVTGKYGDKSERVRLLLDSGSHRTYISKELTDRLGLKEESEQEINVVTFGSEGSKTIKTKSITLKVMLKDGSYMTMTANIVPKISGMLHRSAVNKIQLEKLSQMTRNLHLADTIPTEKEVHSLDLLVGNDFYLDIVNSEKIQVCSGLYLLSSKVGWILSGRAGFVSDTVADDMSMLILSHKDNDADVNNSEFDSVMSVKTNLEEFWSIETIGIVDPPESSDDEKAMLNFKETLNRENGRYSVTWPWKGNSEELPENRGLACGRLRSLVKRIQKETDLMERYDTVIKDQVEKGIIEKVERNSYSGSKHYIPHHVVITPDKNTTKLRIVYDASAKARKQSKSLNECLYRGPVLLRDLCGIFMRFRLPEIGIVSDIEKAFLQVELQQTERDVTRFLWFKDFTEPIIDEDHIQEYRFCRVPFGVVSSPFLLAATVETHLDSYDTKLATQMKDNIYVDNIITGADTVEEAMTLYNAGKSMFFEAKMNLREWITNSEIVNSLIPDIDKTKSEKVKVLGHTWDTKCDTFSVQTSKVINSELPASKRNVLKQIASVYDPLGFFVPVTIQGKTLLQKLWSKKLEWDDLLDPEDKAEWVAIKSDLAIICEVKLKRCISLSGDKNKINFTLVCFCGASIKAYATSIYLVQEFDGVSKSDIVFSKSRLSPIKGMTIPRLELLAVLIGVRCISFVEKELNLPIKDVIVMSDSQCVLHWISSKKVLPVFIENRIKEIRSHDKIEFRYVNTKQNPADIASRGCPLETLQEYDMWWYGPEWLTHPQEQWPNCESAEEMCSKMKPEKESVESPNESIMISQTGISEPPFGIEVHKYSSSTKLIRITAWCRRFLLRLKGEKTSSKCLTSEE